MHKGIYAAAFVACALACGPAAAVDASYSVDSKNSPASIWAKVKGFCGAITVGLPDLKCALSEDGLTRTITLPDGKKVVEKREAFDEAARSYGYTILEAGPLPVTNYHSKLSINAKGEGSQIVWTGHFDAKGASDADAQKAIEGIYKGGADGLAK